MGKWLYRKKEPVNVRGVCVRCGLNAQKRKSPDKYAPLCSQCDKKLYRSEEGIGKDKQKKRQTESFRKRPYRRYVKDQCERCGFEPEDLCQLDVDHIDNNHDNHDPSNLQTLCANCHRLKTKKARRE